MARWWRYIIRRSLLVVDHGCVSPTLGVFSYRYSFLFPFRYDAVFLCDSRKPTSPPPPYYYHFILLPSLILLCLIILKNSSMSTDISFLHLGSMLCFAAFNLPFGIIITLYIIYYICIYSVAHPSLTVYFLLFLFTLSLVAFFFLSSSSCLEECEQRWLNTERERCTVSL